MIQYIDVVIAVNRLNGWREGIEMGALEKQLVTSLEVYKRRGEFRGDMDTALECLRLAEYEIETTK